ncbi:MAG: AbrB/MazE/SpoVT family DNA-binding domain-containing protein [Bacillota bacterium]
MERHKLMISPNGQITLPRKLRKEFSIGDYVNIRIDQGKVVLESVSVIDEFDELTEREAGKNGRYGFTPQF